MRKKLCKLDSVDEICLLCHQNIPVLGEACQEVLTERSACQELEEASSAMISIETPLLWGEQAGPIGTCGDELLKYFFIESS